MAKYGDYAFNPAKARQLLESGGLQDGPGRHHGQRPGPEAPFSVINIGDYSDWVASMQVITQDLKAVGIQLTPDNLTNTDFDADLYYGKYQLAYYDQQTFGPSPYYELRNWLDSAGSAPIGQMAATNYERYSSPATDALFTAYAASTSAAQQHAIMDQVEQVMLSDCPSSRSCRRSTGTSTTPRR